MTTLLFLLTFISLLVLFIILIIKVLRRKPHKRTLKTMAFIICAYAALWFVTYLKSSYTIIPLGTDICFDDWCVTVTSVEKGQDLPEQLLHVSPDSVYIVLHVTMSNHARGITQKPSEPRIHLVDEQRHYWGPSLKGTEAFEKIIGKQVSIAQKLELHESLQTQVVFAIPANARSVKILIEEGPFITKLLLPEDQQVFVIP
jgi:hypothetical protein